MLANVIEGNYPGAAAIKDAPAEIPSAATLAALDNLGPPSTPADGRGGGVGRQVGRGGRAGFDTHSDLASIGGPPGAGIITRG